MGVSQERKTLNKYISFSHTYNNMSTRLIFYYIVLDHFKNVDCVRGNISDSTISVCEPLLLISRSVRISSEVSSFLFLLHTVSGH